MTLFHRIAIVLFVIVGLLLTMVILARRTGRVPGLFGGAGGDSVLGTKAVGAHLWFTSFAFGVFLLLAIALNLTA